MSTDTIYKPKYANSWALVIGINDYIKAPHLNYATNDAQRIAELLIKRFCFPQSNVSLLIDKKAKRDTILNKFLGYANKCEPDDRVLVFFAGHGHTVTGRRGEVGFLVPVDGSTKDLSTLIRWDDLTRNAELIPAKHILFIMDACYGGLAVTRSVPPGNMRFLKDMLQRYSRQVLTAGKADEVVADAGGPRAEHSIFTGHLLDALEGMAVTQEGFLTAHSVMAYVYGRVANDYQSRQSPHYGFVDGDGDFIFDLSPLEDIIEESKKDKDVLFEMPPSGHIPSTSEVQPGIENRVKEYLSDSRYRIRLDDLATTEVRSVIYKLGDDAFSVQTKDVLIEEFVERLRRYEQIVSDLQKIIILLAKWGGADQRPTIGKILARLGEINTAKGGKVAWLGLRWYPIHLLLYSGGIAALAAGDYTNLSTILSARVGAGHSGAIDQEIIVHTVEGILEVSRINMFKKLPGHERNYVPLSEYIFKVLQPPLEDSLFLGKTYESLFDKYEVFYALVYADLTFDAEQHVWGPPGRFAWKYSSRRSEMNPFSEILSEASQLKEKWPPLVNGLFQGSYDRFRQIAEGYEEKLKELNWW